MGTRKTSVLESGSKQKLVQVLSLREMKILFAVDLFVFFLSIEISNEKKKVSCSLKKWVV